MLPGDAVTGFLESGPDATDWDTIHMKTERGPWSVRGIRRLMHRITRRQRDRENHDLGYRDLGGES